MLEKDLRPAVHAWLIGRGYTVIYEFQMHGYCDMVGVTFRERVGNRVPPVVDAVAVELKLHDVAGVLRQAKSNRHVVRASYAAMPRSRVGKMTDAMLRRFEEAGVGLLAVETSFVCGSVITQVAPGPPLSDTRLEFFSRRWWNRIVRDKRLGRRNGPQEGAYNKTVAAAEAAKGN